MISEICFDELLLESTQVVFETMIFMDITKSYDPALKNKDDESILGSITFTGSIEGCLSISCGLTCARQIAMNMLGMDENEPISDEEISDAIGEVSNMVMGSVKGLLDDSPLQIEVSIPSVVKGYGLERCRSDMSDKILLEACLEETHPISILFQYRTVSDQKNGK